MKRKLATMLGTLTAIGGLWTLLMAPGAQATVYSGFPVDQASVPAIAAINGGLAACWVNGALHLIDSAGFVGGTGEAAIGCSVAGFGGQLYVAWTDPSQTVYYTTTAPSGEPSGRIALSGVFSNFAPALAAWNNNLYIAWTGTDGRLNVRDITTSRQNTFESTSAAPALNAGASGLNIAWKGSTNDHINTAALDGGLNETCKQTFQNAQTSWAPGLTSLNGRPYLSWTGEDSGFHINLLADSSTSACAFPDTSARLGDAYRAFTTPGVSPSNGAIWVIWGGTDGNTTLNITQS